MTKEKAISVLKTRSCYECSWGCYSPVNCSCVGCDLTEATEIAIEALEMSKWMPIWDKPPDNDGTYLVSYYYDDFGGKRQGVSIATYGNQGKWHFSGHWWNNDDNNGRPIKAWMPLPGLYEANERMTRTLKEKENKMINDLISRQEAIKAIHEEYDEVLNIDEPGKWIANDVEEILRELPPTAKLENAPPAEPKWIPVSERRPVIFDKFYLVTVQLEPVGRTTDYCVWDGLKWISPLSANPNVIAWMPLPDCYKEQ